MDTSRLEQILEAEASSYAAFVTRIPLKLALIKKGQLVALQQLVAREEADQRALRSLERERIAAAGELNSALGLSPASSLSATLARLPDRQAARRLRTHGDRLIDSAKRLKKGNESCAVLLNAALDFVRYSMEVYARFLNPQERLADMLYGPAVSGAEVSSISLLSESA